MRQAYGLALGTAEDLEARTRHVRFPQSVLPSGSLCFRFARLVPGTGSLIRIPRGGACALCSLPARLPEEQQSRSMATTNLPVKHTDSSLGMPPPRTSWAISPRRPSALFSRRGWLVASCLPSPPSAPVARPSSSPLCTVAEYVVTGLDELANWARKGSMWPMTFGLA